MSKTVSEVIKEYCEANGYDGLYCDECGCTFNDLCPCGSSFEHCEFGYLHQDPGGVYDFIINGEREEAGHE